LEGSIDFIGFAQRVFFNGEIALIHPKAIHRRITR
jgi:hypothetical protein